MNRTSNYNLCQFEENDQVRRTDFNEDNVKLDAALAGVVRRVAELEKDRFYFGSYVGNGASSRTITLPWTPRFMILFSWIYNGDAAIIITPGFSCDICKDTVINTTRAYAEFRGSSLILSHEDVNRRNETSSYILFR